MLSPYFQSNVEAGTPKPVSRYLTYYVLSLKIIVAGIEAFACWCLVCSVTEQAESTQ